MSSWSRKYRIWLPSALVELVDRTAVPPDPVHVNDRLVRVAVTVSPLTPVAIISTSPLLPPGLLVAAALCAVLIVVSVPVADPILKPMPAATENDVMTAPTTEGDAGANTGAVSPLRATRT